MLHKLDLTLHKNHNTYGMTNYHWALTKEINWHGCRAPDNDERSLSVAGQASARALSLGGLFTLRLAGAGRPTRLLAS